MVVVSIVTVVKNEPEQLERTIKSVINQNYNNIEYIIIDGASDDKKTIEVIKQYQKSIDYWVSEPDNGIYDAMNKGVYASNGNWIMFLNAGDELYSNDVIKNIIKKTPIDADLSYGATVFISSDGNKEVVPARDPSTLWMSLNFNHNSLLCKRELLIEHPFDISLKVVADSEFAIWCYSREKIFFNNRIIVNTFTRGGFADQNNLLRIIERWKIVYLAKIGDEVEVNTHYINRLLSEEKQIPLDYTKIAKFNSKAIRLSKKLIKLRGVLKIIKFRRFYGQ